MNGTTDNEPNTPRRLRQRLINIALLLAGLALVLVVVRYSVWGGGGQLDPLRDPQARAAVRPTETPGPTTEVRITEQEANSAVGVYAAENALVDGARVRFVPGEVQIELQSAGQRGTAHIVPTVENGKLVIPQQTLDAPLDEAVPLEDVTGPVVDRLNILASARGQQMVSIAVEQGVVIIQMR